MSETAPEVAAKLSLLNFIEETALFNRQIEALKHWPHFEGQIREQFEKWSNESADSINDGLRQLGGFTLALESPFPQTIILTEWKGQDPTDPQKHKWLVYGQWSHGDFPVDPANYAEIRRNLISDSLA